jgi:integrase
MYHGSDVLFPDPCGNIYTNAKINAAFQLCWKTANADTHESLLPKARVYSLRHRFASSVLCRWIDEGKDLFAMLPYLRTYMGHSSISSTAYYIHILPENIMASKGVDWESLAAVMPEVDVCPE